MIVKVIGSQELLGRGKPDFSKYVSSGQVRPGLRLSSTQSLRLNACVFSSTASPYSWVIAPLAVGATQHIIDQATGLPLPLTVPAGYAYSLIQRISDGTEDVRIDSYLDEAMGVPFLVMSSIVGGGHLFYKKDILGLSTKAIDPNALSAHTVDNTITNLGTAPYEGSLSDIILYETIGTPPLPTTKDVQCKWCRYIVHGVDANETILVCPNCGGTTLYYNDREFRQSA